MLPILDQLFLFHKLLPVCTLQWVKIVFEVAFLFLFTHLCPHKPLKYGFCKKYSDRNEPLTSWTLLSSVFFQISADLEKMEKKSVQLVRVTRLGLWRFLYHSWRMLRFYKKIKRCKIVFWYLLTWLVRGSFVSKQLLAKSIL